MHPLPALAQKYGHSKDALPLALFLMGPTTSGKTDVSLALAHALPVEIISVDSAQIYRGMDIGTAKPDAATLACTPHHLINICNPDASYSAAAFRRDALDKMQDITARNRIPLLVGGTMLYFRALHSGLSELPAANPDVRNQINAQAEQMGWPALHAKLSKLDPDTAERIKPNDAQRIQRALEIHILSGQPMSVLIRQSQHAPLPYRVMQFALIPGDRSRLHERIAVRFADMLKRGLVDELRALQERYALHRDLPSMRCVGYRQAWQYLDGTINRDALLENGIAATRQLAKRQLTWLRSMDNMIAFDCLSHQLAQQTLNVIRQQCGEAGFHQNIRGWS